MKNIKELSYNEIGLNIDPDSLGFEKSGDILGDPVDEAGQKRALDALSQGLGMHHYDFNIYAAGPRETGMMDIVEHLTRQVAADREPEHLYDWCYCYNFRDPDTPVIIRLSAGTGRKFRQEMAEFLASLQLHIPRNFEGDTYLARKEEVIREFNAKRTELFEELDRRVKEHGFILKAEPAGMMVVPASDDGTPMTPDVIAKLDKTEQERLKKTSAEMHKIMGSTMRKLHEMEKKVREQLRNLDREVARQTAEELIAPIKERYADHSVVTRWLDDVVDDVVINFKDFRISTDTAAESQMPFPFPGAGPDFTRYDINLIVDNAESGVPVIVETNPSYPNLFGTLERKAQFGALFTDFTMIRPGSLHKANGGFLIIKAMDLLKWPFSYEALKRTLRNREIE
jgi:hypothetical protein